MKYYLVNYLVVANDRIRHDQTTTLAIPMDRSDCLTAFRKLLYSQHPYTLAGRSLVIKCYKQISEEVFVLLHPFVKENLSAAVAEPAYLRPQYPYTAGNRVH